eukprot:802442-Rhodomonas_salina.2
MGVHFKREQGSRHPLQALPVWRCMAGSFTVLDPSDLGSCIVAAQKASSTTMLPKDGQHRTFGPGLLAWTAHALQWSVPELKTMSLTPSCRPTSSLACVGCQRQPSKQMNGSSQPRCGRLRTRRLLFPGTPSSPELRRSSRPLLSTRL